VKIQIVRPTLWTKCRIRRLCLGGKIPARDRRREHPAAVTNIALERKNSNATDPPHAPLCHSAVFGPITDGKRMWRWKWPHGPQAPTIHGQAIGAPTPPSLSVAASGLGVAVGERRLLYLLDHCGQKQWATAIPRHDLTYRRREMGEPCELPSQQDR
jgi:hypothetical protein